MTDFATAATRHQRPAARLVMGLLAGTMLAGMPASAFAQEEGADALAPATAPAVQRDIVQTIAVSGAQRLEAQTILSYISLRSGDVWTQAAGDDVEAKPVGLDRHPAERRAGIDVEQCPGLAAQLADAGQRLRHGGRGVAMHGRQNARAASFQRLGNRLERDHLAPRRFQHFHLGPHPREDLDQEQAEASEIEHQHPVPRCNHAHQR